MHNYETRKMLSRAVITVEDDPDYEGFFSIFATWDGSGAELAGKIGEKNIALAMAEALQNLAEAS